MAARLQFPSGAFTHFGRIAGGFPTLTWYLAVDTQGRAYDRIFAFGVSHWGFPYNVPVLPD